MDPFVQRLVQRLLDPAQPLSRNRHFATLDSSEGRQALRLTRRLRSLQADVKAASAEGQPPRLVPASGERGGWRLELTLPKTKGIRSTWLADFELRLLRGLPEMAELLREAR